MLDLDRLSSLAFVAPPADSAQMPADHGGNSVVATGLEPKLGQPRSRARGPAGGATTVPPSPGLCADCRSRSSFASPAGRSSVRQARGAACKCPTRNGGGGGQPAGCWRPSLPHSPLYPGHLFPTLQMLLSRSSSSLPVVFVTPASFRKHILRIKPELKRLVPALLQADSEAEHDASEDIRHTSGCSDLYTSPAPPRSPDGPSASARRVVQGADLEATATTAASNGPTKKERLARPVGEDDAESSNEDDDLPLCYKLQRRESLRTTPETTSCDTPPGEPVSPPPSEDKLQASQPVRGNGCQALERLSPSKMRCRRQLVAIEALATKGQGHAAARQSCQGRAGGVSYGRKRWKVVGLREKRRQDGSWGMTLRLRRKRRK